MIYLKASTASQEILLGPFVDSTDGNTAETALTINNTDIKIFKAGATTLANKNSGGATHISNGNYYTVLDATDTDTVGSGSIVVQVSGALAVRHNFTVLPALVYDSLIGGTDNLQVDTIQAAGTTWGSGAITAASIADNAIDLATFAADAKALMGVIAFGTAQSVTGTTIQLASAETFADDELIGATVIIRSATTGAGQARVITDYVSATDTATVDTWTTTPTGTITYIVIASAPASTSAPIAANVTQFAGTAITSAAGIPEVKVASIANNAITAASIATNAIDADAIATDAVTEIQSGLSTLTQANIRTAVGLASANLDTQLTAIDDFIDTEVAAILAAVDTEVAAIKAKTDSLTFTVAGQVDANIQSVNDVTVNGNGAGTPWGP